MDILNEFSKLRPDIDKKKNKKVNEMRKIRIVKKNLLTSATSIFELENLSLVI